MINIRTKLIAVLILISMLFIATACAGSGSGNAPDPGQTGQTQASEPVSAADGTGVSLTFRPGIWTAICDGVEDSYFYFDENDMSGTQLSLASGTGIGFDYERGSDDAAVFHFGAADNNSPCSVTVSEDGSVTLGFDGYSYTLVYLTEDLELVWYSNSELEEMAMKYYAANNDGYTPGCVGSAVNEDGTVSIQLYDQLEDHNSTCAWYTVDRFTAAGTDDITQESVDLSGYAAQ